MYVLPTHKMYRVKYKLHHNFAKPMTVVCLNYYNFFFLRKCTYTTIKILTFQ